MSGAAPGITIETVRGDNSTDAVVTVAGDFDSTQVDTFEMATAQIPDSIGSVLVDVSGCTILDSASLGALIRLKLRLEDHGSSFAIAADKSFQRLVFASTGLGDYLGLRDPD